MLKLNESCDDIVIGANIYLTVDVEWPPVGQPIDLGL
jgi:hypothetical protein